MTIVLNRKGGIMFKKILSMITIIGMLFNISVYAEQDSSFSDVSESDWFYESVMAMHKYGIISGYDDGTFRPESIVTREEFATMMVKSLQLEIVESTSSFSDVGDDYWASKWIETAKPFLTGFVKNGVYSFKPKDVAVREDMAVALVKALGKSVTQDQLVYLDDFEDSDQISDNLKGYMASAIANNLISGTEINGKKYINPVSTLKRSEAAALLISIVNEEKITFEDEIKIVLDGDNTGSDLSTNTKPTISIAKTDESIVISWDPIDKTGLQGYKVVASLNDSTPVYPENGYATFITNLNTLTYTIKEGMHYNGGDFGGEFEEGESYYFSVTAVYDSGKIAGNTISSTMPGYKDDDDDHDDHDDHDDYDDDASLEDRTPEVEVSVKDDRLIVKWDEIDSSKLQGYKIVASKSNSNPAYPADGYAYYITDLSVHSKEIYPNTTYNSGDLGGKFISGQSYYISVTALYGDERIAGNSVKVVMP